MNAPAVAVRPPASHPAPPDRHQHDGTPGGELQSLIAALEPMLLAPTPASERLQAAANLIGSIVEAAGSSSLLGFQEICMLFNERVIATAASPDITPAQGVLLAAWPALARAYIANPGHPDTGDALIRHLEDPAWPTPLSPDDAELLREWSCPGEPRDDACEALGAPLQITTAGETSFATEVSTTASVVSADVLHMLRAAMQDLATLTEESTAAHPGVLHKVARRVERFRAAAEMGGLRCAQTIASMVNDNLRLAREDAPAVTMQLLRSWSVRMLDYLQQPGDVTASMALVDLLCDRRWSQPVAESSRDEILGQLRAVATVEPERLQRQREIRPEDLSLTIPEDAPRDLLEAILHELPGHAAVFASAMQRLSGDGGSLQELDAARRVAHTLKGAANTVGVRAIAVLMHHVEDILDALRARALLPAAKLAGMMVEVADCLEEMTEALAEGKDAPPQTRAVLQAVLDWAHRMDQDGLPEDACRTAPPEHVSRSEADEPAGTGDVQAGVGAAAHVPKANLDELTRLISETLIANSQLRNGLQTVTRYVLGLRQQNANLLQLVGDLEQQVDRRGGRAGGKHPKRRREDFDPLELERYDNLHTVTHRLQEAVADSHTLNTFVDQQLNDLADLIVKQDVQNKEAYEQAMRMRMVPARSVLPRLQRVVRQTGRMTGKEAVLAVEGMDTLIDSEILKHLVDALMHILRNAVDHGIESSEERQRAGKQSVGRITLVFQREGSRILVRCQDDGAGLDFAAIHKRGVETGCIRHDENMTEQALVDLILRPGFSTRAAITETSGRGVGLDVVLTQAAKIKGSLRIFSRPGQGCLVELRLPVMLTSTHALLIPAHSELHALSSAGVSRIFHPGYGRIEERDGKLIYHFDDTSAEAVCFETLIHRSVDASAPIDRRPALLVEADYGDRVILVPGIVDTRDVIIKAIGCHLPPVHGLVGATILGDGSVAAVLDAAELLRPAASVIDHGAGERGPSTEQPARRRALVVDDSISARRALAQCLEDSGFEVLTAKDGLEAVDILDKKRIDVLLVDLEMPRMNGLELVTHVRLREDLQYLPVIMTTSRSTQKHRQQAHAAGVDVYLTKPFNEDDMLTHAHELLRRSSVSKSSAANSETVARMPDAGGNKRPAAGDGR
ncbi:MAG: response regulator [Chromatiales bacterium]